jgi:hypothetical protein
MHWGTISEPAIVKEDEPLELPPTRGTPPANIFDCLDRAGGRILERVFDAADPGRHGRVPQTVAFSANCWQKSACRRATSNDSRATIAF